MARRLDGKAVAANTLPHADRVAQAPLQGGLLIAGSVVCLFGLMRIERRSTSPLVPTDLFAVAAFRFSALALVCCFTGQMLGLIALPFYLQHRLGMTATEAGIYMMPWPAAVAVIAPISARLADRVKTAWLCAAGGALLAIGLASVGLLTTEPRGATFVVGTIIASLGFGLFQAPNNRVLLLSAPKARSGAAGAMQGTARLTGQTLGAIAMAIIFGIVLLASAPEFALVLAAVFSSLAAVVSLGRARHEAVYWKAAGTAS